ncbi:MAG: efflux RND transporter periplasmic adaptor subunit [Candidatus Eisenbacteria bacterium]
MKKRRLVIIGAVIVVAVIAVILISATGNRTEQDQKVRTVTVARGDIVIKVTESGEVQPLTTVNIKSELAGEVQKLYVEEGDSVKAGDHLALVQQESSQAQQVAQARASIEQAQLDLVDAERHLKRQQELFSKGFISKKEVEDAEQAYKRVQIQVELSEKKLWLVLGGSESVKSQSIGAKSFDNIIVASPISGVVLNLNVEEGEMITSGTQAYGGGGTTIMTIADLSKMIVNTDINEVDVSRVRVGQPAQIGFDAIRDISFRGVVKKIAPAGVIEGNIVVFPVEVEITGSVSGQFQRSDSGQPPRQRGEIFSQLSEEQRNSVRAEMQALREQGAGPEEMQRYVESALKKFGLTPPEDSPRPAFPSSLEGEEEQAGIELIRPGMTADLDIIIARAENVIYVPKEAIVQYDGRPAVMLHSDEETVTQPVVTGLEDDVNVEIREGLEEGDQVILSGFQSGSSQGSERSQFRGPPM